MADPVHITEHDAYPEYEEIPRLRGGKSTDERIAADNKALSDKIKAQTGTFVGYHDDQLGQRWEQRKMADGSIMLMRADPTDPLKYQYWDRRSPPQTGYLGGEEYYQEVNNLRRELSDSGGPYPGQKWDKDVLGQSYGELRSNQQDLHTFKEYHAPNPQDTDAISRANKISGYLQAFIKNYDAAGGKDAFSKWAQLTQGLETSTDLGHWVDEAKGKAESAQRQAFVKALSNLHNLAADGYNLGRLNVEDTSAAGSVKEGVNQGLDILGMLSPKALIGSILGKGTLAIAQGIANGQFDVDALRANVPNALHQVDRSLYDSTRVLSGPESKTLLPEDIRQYGRNAAARLHAAGIGPDDNIAEKSEMLPEKPEQKPEAKPAAQSKTTTDGQTSQEEPSAAGGGGLATAGRIGRQQPLGQTPIGQWVGGVWKSLTTPTPIQGTGGLAGASRPDTSQPEQPKTPQVAQPQQPKMPTSANSKGPMPAPLNVPPIQVSPITSNTKASEDYPRLTEQEDVNGLDSGTPFYWRDHENAYVKV